MPRSQARKRTSGDSDTADPSTSVEGGGSDTTGTLPPPAPKLTKTALRAKLDDVLNRLSPELVAALLDGAVDPSTESTSVARRP